MAKRDPYEVLGVSREASGDDIKRAYRAKAKELHPDRNKDRPDAESAFKEVGEAYDVLKDPQKKAAYDRFGQAAFEGGGPQPTSGFAGGGGGHGNIFSNMFDDLFGGFPGHGHQQQDLRGSDLRYNMRITLEDAYRGLRPTLSIPRAATCDGCGGSGAEGDSRPTACPTCAGEGKVRSQHSFLTVERTCPSCGGQGQIITNPCKSCGGQGRVQKNQSISVSIPPGVDTGTRVRVAGEGEAGVSGGPPGDLYIFIEVAPSEIFERSDNDLLCEVPVSMADAVLGGEVEVPTVEGGRSRVKIPAGSQSGSQLRLKGKGMPMLHDGPHGDMIIELVVETPVNLTPRQKELMREFASESNDNSPRSSTFFRKVRSFWDSVKG